MIKLILYTKGNRKQHQDKFGKEHTFINTRRQDINVIVGMRFDDVLFLDDGITSEEARFAKQFVRSVKELVEKGKQQLAVEASLTVGKGRPKRGKR